MAHGVWQPLGCASNSGGIMFGDTAHDNEIWSGHEPGRRAQRTDCRGRLAGGGWACSIWPMGALSRQSVELAAECGTQETFGVRVPYGCALRPDDVDRLAPGRVHTVCLGWNSPWQVADIAVATE